MQLPDIANMAKDPKRKITYKVMAYRKLEPGEVEQAVRYFLSRNKRRIKPGTEVTILTVIQ